MNETKTNTNTISLQTFVQDFHGELLDRVKTQCPPRFTNALPNDEQCLQTLKRSPYPAQAKVIHATKQLLVNTGHRAGIINADMGTGKSLMGIGVAALCHYSGYKRTLIVCPPHLVYKWKREITMTLPDVDVIILNGASALAQLQSIRAQYKTYGKDKPVFFIIGRVRLRLGHYWKPAFVERQHIVHCPNCGEAQLDNDGLRLLAVRVNRNKKYVCDKCGEPLWQLTHRKALQSERDQLISALSKLPTIGKKMATQLIERFGERFISDALSDNVYQLTNLMDEYGEFIFNDTTAKQLEKTLAHSELLVGRGNYQLSEYLKRYFPPRYFGLLIVDEAHEYKNNSAQGIALASLTYRCAKKTLLLTGTLMGGYASDLFYLLFRTMPSKMIQDGYRYNERGNLNAALRSFMAHHGVLENISFQDRQDGESYKTARGTKHRVSVKKAPGISPQAIMRYIIPYTAFLRLEDIGKSLPDYQEDLVRINLTVEQGEVYKRMVSILGEELNKALGRGDRGMMGVVLNALLSYPETSHLPTVVRDPYDRGKILFAADPVIDDDTPSPKEAHLIEAVLTERNKGRKSLVYALYTQKRDITLRLARLLTQAGLHVAVLKSSVTTDKRELWIADKIEQGIDVLICHPKLVETGLDLLDFPSIFFLQTGYNVYTLMQASKRSWRIGQTQPVKVHYLGYNKTAQANCLKLMQKKITVAQSTSGVVPECGLDILNQSADSVEIQLAKAILNQRTTETT